MSKAQAVRVGAIKVTVPIKASALPVSRYPREGTAPAVRLRIDIASGGVLTAELSGKSFRKAAKRLQPMIEAGTDPLVIVQGSLTGDRTLHGVGLSIVEAKS